METKKIPVSVVVITKNEEDNIADCLKSVSWADELIVLDDNSTDKTVEIAKRYTDKIESRKMDIEGRHRNYAYSLARNDWVLSLDADERITDKLREELTRLVKKGSGHCAFTVPIKTYIGDHWMRYGDWYPGRKTRC